MTIKVCKFGIFRVNRPCFIIAGFLNFILKICFDFELSAFDCFELAVGILLFFNCFLRNAALLGFIARVLFSSAFSTADNRASITQGKQNDKNTYYTYIHNLFTFCL